MTEITIICPLCSKRLTVENTGSLGSFQPECNDCRKKFGLKPDIIERYAKLLEFVKNQAKYDKSFVYAYEVIGERARELLKEIGEE